MATCLYIADELYRDQLHHELSEREEGAECEEIAPGVFLSDKDLGPIAWAQCIWHDVETLSISSIGDAAKKLRERGPYWHGLTLNHARRTQLIADKLLKIKDKVAAFPLPKQPKPRRGFILRDEQTMLVAGWCDRPFADGIVRFTEDRENPPSRAYMKIWEAFTLLGEWPKPGEGVLELGAAPGAWTWTFANLGADVFSIDKAPLDPRIDAMPNVHHSQESAFGLEPADFQVQWLCSDIICYPERLINLINRWDNHPTCQRFIITIKFQGETDFEAIKKLQEIPNSYLLHLSANKHEVTWIKHPNITTNQPPAWPWPTAVR